MIRSGEADVALVLPGSEIPVALYGVDDEADCDVCSACRNCCRMSVAELVLDELLLVPPVEDEVSGDDEPPWLPSWPWCAPPAPPNADWKMPCNSVACALVSLPLDTSPAIRVLTFDCRLPGDEFVALAELLVLLPLCSEELMSVSAEDKAL